MGREAGSQVRSSDWLLVVGEDLELVEVGVTEELTSDGVAEPIHNSVVFLGPLVWNKRLELTYDASCARKM